MESQESFSITLKAFISAGAMNAPWGNASLPVQDILESVSVNELKTRIAAASEEPCIKQLRHCPNRGWVEDYLSLFLIDLNHLKAAVLCIFDLGHSLAQSTKDFDTSEAMLLELVDVLGSSRLTTWVGQKEYYFKWLSILESMARYRLNGVRAQRLFSQGHGVEAWDILLPSDKSVETQGWIGASDENVASSTKTEFVFSSTFAKNNSQEALTNAISGVHGAFAIVDLQLAEDRANFALELFERLIADGQKPYLTGGTIAESFAQRGNFYLAQKWIGAEEKSQELLSSSANLQNRKASI